MFPILPTVRTACAVHRTKHRSSSWPAAQPLMGAGQLGGVFGVATSADHPHNRYNRCMAHDRSYPAGQ
jgi:hypothetical protein